MSASRALLGIGLITTATEAPLKPSTFPSVEMTVSPLPSVIAHQLGIVTSNLYLLLTYLSPEDTFS